MTFPFTAALLAWILFDEEIGLLGLLGADFLLGAMSIILLVPTKHFEKGGNVNRKLLLQERI